MQLLHAVATMSASLRQVQLDGSVVQVEFKAWSYILCALSCYMSSTACCVLELHTLEHYIVYFNSLSHQSCQRYAWLFAQLLGCQSVALLCQLEACLWADDGSKSG